MELEKQYAWVKKGKKYKTKYFAALGQLFGSVKDDEKSKEQGGVERSSNRGDGSDQIGDMVAEIGHQGECVS